MPTDLDGIGDEVRVQSDLRQPRVTARGLKKELVGAVVDGDGLCADGSIDPRDRRLHPLG